MRPAILISIVVVCLSIIIYNLTHPAGQQNQKHAPTDRTVHVSLPTNPKPDPAPPIPTVVELQRATAILDDTKWLLMGEDDEKHVTIAVLELARAIVEQHVLKTRLSTAQLDEALAVMFVDPNDPNSSMREDVYEDLETGVWHMSNPHEVVNIFRATEDDHVFTGRPKQEWKIAHAFIRVERTLDNGTKRVSGVIISAPLDQK